MAIGTRVGIEILRFAQDDSRHRRDRRKWFCSRNV